MKALGIAAAYLAAGLVGGFALSALMGEDTAMRSDSFQLDDASLERRVARLESQLEAVTQRNQRLTEQLSELDIMSIESMPAAAAPQQRADTTENPADSAEADPNRAERIVQARQSRARQFDLVEQLTSAGFTQADARHIETRLEELRVDAMQSRYEALRSGEPQNALSAFGDGSATLRTELGDDDYARYLAATGRPTNVGVSTVLSSSAAQTAGIMAGDEIVSYAGQRVFDTRELNQLLLEGNPGEQVIVDIERDGQPLQLVMPRGPLGITSGFNRRGGR